MPMRPLLAPLSRTGPALPRTGPALPRPGPARPRAGLTLIELMVTLAVAVVMMAMAVPSMGDFLESHQVAAIKSSLSGAVALARSEAVKRGQTVILKAIGDGPDGNEYVNGWEVVVDEDGNGSAGSSETRVRRADQLQARLRSGGPRSLAFLPSGALSVPAAQVFTLCRQSGSSAGFRLTVAPSGVADVLAITTCGA